MDNSYALTIIKSLFNYKKQPFYSAERQIGLLIVPFLENIFFVGHKFVTIEFPLLKENNNQPELVVDFVMIMENNPEPNVKFIELKTDRSTFGKKELNQLEIYKKINSKSLNIWVQKIIDYVGGDKIKSEPRSKYFYILNNLYKVGLVKSDLTNHKYNCYYNKISKLENTDSPHKKSERSKIIIKIAESVNPINAEISVLYLIPNEEKLKIYLKKEGIKYVTFIDKNLPKSSNIFNEEYKLLRTGLLKI